MRTSFAAAVPPGDVKVLSKRRHRFEVYAVNADGRKSDTVRWEFTVA